MSWETKPISELGKIVTGKTPSTKNQDFYDGEFPFVTPTDLDWQTYYVRGTHSTVTKLAKDKHKNQFIPAGSTTFTCIGNTIGKCGIASEPSLTNQQINSIVPNDEHDPRFVYYLMLQNKDTIRSIGLSGGAAQPIINKSTFSNIKVRAPDLPTQERIAGVLSAYDDLIETNRRRIALLEQAARLLYREWFVHFRFPGHETTKFSDGLPEGWSIQNLDVIADFHLGKMLDQKKNRGTLLPYLANKNVRWGEFDYTELREMRFEEREIGRFSVKNGDIVMCEGGEPGRCAIWREEIPNMMYQKALHRIRPVSGMGTNFLYHALSYRAKAGHLSGLFTGATIKHLPKEKLKLVPVCVPIPSLIEDFEKLIGPMELQQAELQKANSKLAQARDLLLPRLMDGRISVSG